MDTRIFRNDIQVSLIFHVNLRELWKPLTSLMDLPKSTCANDAVPKQSSMYLQNKSGIATVYCFNICCPT